MSEIIKDCPQMQRLRNELDAMNIYWCDDSEVIYGRLYIRVMLRTKWQKDGNHVSVIWGYYATPSYGHGLSFGYPDKLECYYHPNYNEPIAMSVEEILEVCA